MMMLQDEFESWRKTQEIHRVSFIKFPQASREGARGNVEKRSSAFLLRGKASFRACSTNITNIYKYEYYFHVGGYNNFTACYFFLLLSVTLQLVNSNWITSTPKRADAKLNTLAYCCRMSVAKCTVINPERVEQWRCSEVVCQYASHVNYYSKRARTCGPRPKGNTPIWRMEHGKFVHWQAEEVEFCCGYLSALSEHTRPD